MEYLISIVFILGGLVSIFYLRPRIKSKLLEIQYIKTTSIKGLLDNFKSMIDMGLGDSYREYVELKGKIANKGIETPFSNRMVGYVESAVYSVSEKTEVYYDKDNNRKTRIEKVENLISRDKSSQDIEFYDNSSDEKITLEINAVGCELDINKTFDRFEPKSNLSRYSYFNSMSFSNTDSNHLGYRMEELVIDENQNLYVIGEAYAVGDRIHIGKSLEKDKPFIVSTKSEEDLVNTNKNKEKIALFGGIIAIVIGVVILVSKIL